jgi:hypothetical protein
VPTAGGINPEEETFDQSRRRLRLSGRDETGENFGAELYLPSGPVKPGDHRTSDAALLGNLENRDPFEECASLAAYQRMLNRHYRQ